jgi:hypothetical protein
MERTASVQSSNIQLTCPQRAGEKIDSDFRRDHATSPCLSTAIGNRELPRRRMVGPQIFVWVPVPFVAMPRGRVPRGVGFSIKTVRTPASAVRAGFRNVAKIGQIIFSRSSRRRSRL